MEILERIRKLPRFDKKKFRAYQVEIELLRAEASQDIVEIIDAIEGKEAHRFWLQKKAYDDSIGDPDDIYFEVLQREDERRKQGLAPRLEILRMQLAENQKKDQKEKQEHGKQKKLQHKAGSQNKSRIRISRRSAKRR